MSTSINWPATLPTGAVSLQEKPDANTLEFKMDAGQNKRRRKYTSVMREYSASYALTATQQTALQTFYVTTTLYGIYTFNWTDPRTGVVREVRFIRPPVYTTNGPEYLAKVDVEVL